MNELLNLIVEWNETKTIAILIFLVLAAGIFYVAWYESGGGNGGNAS